jgi:hypothetical protein
MISPIKNSLQTGQAEVFTQEKPKISIQIGRLESRDHNQADMYTQKKNVEHRRKETFDPMKYQHEDNGSFIGQTEDQYRPEELNFNQSQISLNNSSFFKGYHREPRLRLSVRHRNRQTLNTLQKFRD